MRAAPRRFHLCIGLVNAIAICVLMYVVVSGFIEGRPWWLVLGPALTLPEMTLHALGAPRNAHELDEASRRPVRRATRVLSLIGLLLLGLGITIFID